MTRLTASMVSWFCLIATLAPRVAVASPDTSIVPGQSIGLLRLGTPVRALFQAPGWGQPDRTHASGSISYLSYERHRVTVATRDALIILILTTSERFRTEKGVAVGQTASAAATAYGAAPASGDSRVHWYDGLGLLVVTGGNTIIRIGVYDPKHFVRAILADEVPARDVFLSARLPKSAGPARAKADAASQTAIVTITLKNTSLGDKVLNPNFFTLVDREEKSYRYDRSTFAQKDACRSTRTVRPGATGSCSLVFVVSAGRKLRSIVFNDGGSVDEFYF
ncbi:MAG: DUF4352 domain-containing protein [Armatimonadota bacterium]